MRRGKKKKNIK